MPANHAGAAYALAILTTLAGPECRAVPLWVWCEDFMVDPRASPTARDDAGRERAFREAARALEQRGLVAIAGDVARILPWRSTPAMLRAAEARAARHPDAEATRIAAIVTGESVPSWRSAVRATRNRKGT